MASNENCNPHVPTDNSQDNSSKKFIVVTSEEQNMFYKRYQDTSNSLTIESIAINALVREANENIATVARRRRVLEAKRNVVGV